MNKGLPVHIAFLKVVESANEKCGHEGTACIVAGLLFCWLIRGEV